MEKIEKIWKKRFKKLAAFTLAEVLITLAIIGLVAALTIPTVITNYKKNLYVTQLKKAYNNIQNGFHMAMAREGVMKLSDTKLWSISMTSSSTFPSKDNYPVIKGELSKIFNLHEVQADKIQYKKLNGRDADSYSNNLCFEDGTCILNLVFYRGFNTANCGENHKCSSFKEFQEYKNTPTKLWQQAAYITLDVNGSKAPNQYGRDAFPFVIGNDGNLYPRYGVDDASYTCNYNMVLQNTCAVYWRYNSNSNSNGLCNPFSTEVGIGCAARIMEEGWKMNY